MSLFDLWNHRKQKIENTEKKCLSKFVMFGSFV